MKVTFVLLLIALLTAEYQCRRGGWGSWGGRGGRGFGISGRGRGSSGSKISSYGSSGGRFRPWLGFGGSKSSSSSHSKPVPSVPAAFPSAPESLPNSNPIGFEHFGQDGNRHVYNQNNNKFVLNTYPSGPHNYGINKDNKPNSGRIVPIPVPVPIGGGSSYHHSNNDSYHYGQNNITTGKNHSTTGMDPADLLNPGLDPDSLYFPHNPGNLFPKSGNEDLNGTLWETRKDLFLRKYGKLGNQTSFNVTDTPRPTTL